MHDSFVNLIGIKHFRPGETISSLGGNSTFICNAESTNDEKSYHAVHVRFAKDEGGNGYPKSPRGVYFLDNDTQTFIQYSRERVLAIFNIGAHYHNFTHYSEDMHTMLKLLSNLNRPRDLVMFRATSPGHDNCQPRSRSFNWTHGTRITPLSSFSEYKVSTPHKYDWDKFEYYNHYTEKLLHNRNIAGQSPIMHFLDVYNMTVLRQDSHTAPADCLHFYSPGPVDWWNHLMLTYLQNLPYDNSGVEGVDVFFSDHLCT